MVVASLSIGLTSAPNLEFERKHPRRGYPWSEGSSTMATMPAKRTRLELPTSYSFAVSDSGDHLAALGRNVVIVDPRRLVRRFSCHPLSHPSKASFNSDGSLLAVKNTSGRIVLIDSESGNVALDFDKDWEGEGTAVRFSPEDTYLVDGFWDGMIRVRLACRAKVESQFRFAGEMIMSLSCSRDRRLWCFAHQPKVRPGAQVPDHPPYVTIWEWPLRGASQRFNTPLTSIDSAALSPDGNTIVLTGCSAVTRMRKVVVVTREGSVLHSLSTEIGGTGSALCWSPDGAYIGSVQDGRIVVYRAEDMAERGRVELEYPSGVAFSPDHSFVAFGSWKKGWVESPPSSIPLSCSSKAVGDCLRTNG